MADSTVENSDTLKQQLKTILSESFYDRQGINLNEEDDGSCRVLKAIQILISLRKVESGIEENSVTLRKELKKILAESIYKIDLNVTNDGESCRVPKEKIDEAIAILTRLRKEEESEHHDQSDVHVSKRQKKESPKVVVVPNKFKCLFTNEIFIDPVIIASGETYERAPITEWLRYEATCPKTKRVLSNPTLTPNHLVDKLIREWCEDSKYDREEKVTELEIDGITSLLQRISTPYSVLDQSEAANELRRQTKNFANVRDLFSDQFPDFIIWLLNPFSAEDEAGYSNYELQENLITALYNISQVEKNKTFIAKNLPAIEVLRKSLSLGTVHTKRNAASTLWSLSVIESNKGIIGKSETVAALMHLIREGDLVATRAAASTLSQLCAVMENRERRDFIFELQVQIRANKSVHGLVAILEAISRDSNMVEVMGNARLMNDMLTILRRPSNMATTIKALGILFKMCKGNEVRLRELKREENQEETLMRITQQGLPTYPITAVHTAEAILSWLKKLG